MDQHLVFLLLGLANGAVFASLALALVVTYRSSGVVNFATGSMALASAYVYAFLRQGEFVLLVPGLPHSIDLGRPMPFAGAVAITLLFDAALGLALYVSTFRPLRRASGVAKAVASLGVMVVVTGIIVQRLGTSPVAVASIFPTNVWIVGSVRISSDRIWFAATVIALTGLIAAGYRFTRFGLHTRAASESEKGAYVSRISPDRIAAINWVISAVVAGLAGIMIAPITPLVPYSYTLFIVPALAAAIVGGFDNLGVAVGAGLAIGMLQSETTYLQTQHSWLPSSGLAELVPMLLILLVLVVRAKPLPPRGEIVRIALARAPRPQHLSRSALVGATAGVIAILVTTGSWRSALVTSFIFAIIALSIVVVTGFAGQVSLAQLTLAGVAAFLLGPLTNDWGVPFPIAPIVAALGATLIGVVVGIPALRIRGLQFAIVTLALAVTVQAIWFQNTDLVGTAGETVKDPKLFGLALGPGTGSEYPRPAFCLMVLVVLVGVALVVARLRRSALGSAMLAVRANERSAAATGINVVGTKIAAFVIAAFIAGLGGTMYAYRLGNVTWDSFDVLLGLGVFAVVYVAGITSVSGGVLAGLLAAGGIISYAGSRWISLDVDRYTIVTGVALVVSVITNPDGLVGNLHRMLDRRRKARRNPADESSRPPASITIPQEAPSRRTGVAMAVRDLTVHYGGVVAVDGVSFDVPRDAIVGLIGPNGAGKTSVIDAISGFCRCAGTVELDGAPLDGLPPHRRVRRGLGRTFQGIELWDELTVAENVFVGPGRTKQGGDHASGLFELLRLTSLRDRPAGELSQGQRQLVSIARALVASPEVVLLDEPAAGLDTSESAWLAARLRDIRDAGTTVLLVDHDMNLVLNLCDHIEVLDFGRIIASGSPSEIRCSSVVADAYLGTTHATPEVVVP